MYSLEIQTLARLVIDVRLGQEATAESILAERPDIVVIATGARIALPRVEGLTQALESGYAVTIDSILAGENVLTPGPVAIWGASEGIELALDLARGGHQVRLFDPKPKFAPASYIGSRARPLLRWMAQANLTVEVGVELLSVEADRIGLRHADGRAESVRCNKLILAPGRIAEDPLSPALMRKGVIVQVIGDARRPRSYGNAIHEAAYLARRI